MPLSFHDWDQFPVLEGKLVGKLKNIGAWKKYAFGFELSNGSVIYSWYYAQLRTIMEMNFGTVLRITYEGTVKDEETNRSMRNFKIELLDYQPPKPKKVAKKKENINANTENSEF